VKRGGTLTLLVAVGAAPFGWACAEAVKTAPPPLAGTPDAGMTTPEPDAGMPDAGAPMDAGPPNRTLVINEVQASGDDWIEVANVSGADLDVSGFVVTQTDDMGVAEPGESSPFPAGYTIAAGGHFVVLAGLAALADGVQSDCVLPGVTECLYATFGVSSGSGDTLVILDGSGAEIERVVVPGNAATEDETYARVPDGTGDFVATTPTPAASN